MASFFGPRCRADAHSVRLAPLECGLHGVSPHLFHSFPTMIHPTAVIHPDAKIGADCEIGPFCVIGANVTLGDAAFGKSSSADEREVRLPNFSRIVGITLIATIRGEEVARNAALIPQCDQSNEFRCDPTRFRSHVTLHKLAIDQLVIHLVRHGEQVFGGDRFGQDFG